MYRENVGWPLIHDQLTVVMSRESSQIWWGGGREIKLVEDLTRIDLYLSGTVRVSDFFHPDHWTKPNDTNSGTGPVIHDRPVRKSCFPFHGEHL